ncbi:hypothetical protein QJQ45_014638 [Haematococcus lacustris]|nr:hypothetical protein QJQ45_014638 [Haematococcus lacustris]
MRHFDDENRQVCQKYTRSICADSIVYYQFLSAADVDAPRRPQTASVPLESSNTRQLAGGSLVGNELWKVRSMPGRHSMQRTQSAVANPHPAASIEYLLTEARSAGSAFGPPSSPNADAVLGPTAPRPMKGAWASQASGNWSSLLKDLSFPQPPASPFNLQQLNSRAQQAPLSLESAQVSPGKATGMLPSRLKLHAKAMWRKPPEEIAAELMHTKDAFQRLTEEHKLLSTEKRRLEAQLSLARSNVLKAEELLNNKERSVNRLTAVMKRTVSPNRGLSQLYRNPDTTALVGRLKEEAHRLRLEKEQLQAQVKAGKMDIRATHMNELQIENQAFREELSRQQVGADGLVGAPAYTS